MPTARRSASGACGGTFDEDSLSASLAEADAAAQDPDIWSDPDRAREVMRQRSDLQRQLETASGLRDAAEELEVLLEMARDGETGLEAELGAVLEKLGPMLDRLELVTKMTGEHDASNAYVEIHPGAGGTDSPGLGPDAAAHVHSAGASGAASTPS